MRDRPSLNRGDAGSRNAGTTDVSPPAAEDVDEDINSSKELAEGDELLPAQR